MSENYNNHHQACLFSGFLY